MIIDNEDVLLDIVLDDVKYSRLNLDDVEDLLQEYKIKYNDLTNKQMCSIPNCYAYFVEDTQNNKFTCKIYKTSIGTDRWIMLMSDDYEGYALYENPENHEKQLAWYHRKLEKPLTALEEEKIRKCYVPQTKVKK